MLTAYLARTRQLLQNPAATTALYSDADLTAYINSARGQLAGETECCRSYNTLALTYNTTVYSFASISTTAPGTQGAFTIRGATLGLGSGQVWMAPRPFPWFQFYYLNTVVPTPGQPSDYAQFKQGEGGSLYIWPPPDNSYTMSLDCVAVPSDLAADADVEAIPYPFTDAVPYYAAYLALSSAQRTADADQMFKEYQKFAQRGRQMSNGSVLPQQFVQHRNIVRAGQLGMQQVAGG